MASKLKQTYKKILKSPTFLKIAGYLIYLYAKLIFKTCKWDHRNIDTLYKTLEKENIIAIGWHGRIAMLPFLKGKQHEANALVSLHQDGMLIANFLKILDIGIIGGSSSRNAKAAAINLKNSLNKENKTVFIVPDGPIGPNMKMTPSPVYFAKISGKPIFGVVYSIKNSKIMKKAWDQMMLPPPFSKGIIEAIGPFYIPENATDEELAKYTQDIEDKMNNTLFEIDEKMGIPKVEVGKVSKKRYKKEM